MNAIQTTLSINASLCTISSTFKYFGPKKIFDGIPCRIAAKENLLHFHWSLHNPLD